MLDEVDGPELTLTEFLDEHQILHLDVAHVLPIAELFDLLFVRLFVLLEDRFEVSPYQLEDAREVHDGQHAVTAHR